MPTGSLATRNLNARFLGQPFVYRSYPERIRREQRCSSRMHTCPTLGPRRGKRESFVVPGSPRDTVNINKRSQEAVSRSVDFIGSSRLSSFRFFFQQPAITPGCSFTRPPLPRYSVSCNRSDGRSDESSKEVHTRIFFPSPLSFLPLHRPGLIRLDRNRCSFSKTIPPPLVPSLAFLRIIGDLIGDRWKEIFSPSIQRFIRLINYAPTLAVDLNLFILDYPAGLSRKMIVFDRRRTVNG